MDRPAAPLGVTPRWSNAGFLAHHRPVRQQQAVRFGRWKLLVDGGQFLLFDLADDPGETHRSRSRGISTSWSR